MSNPNGRKRSPISALLAVFVVAVSLVALSVMKVNSFFRRKYVPIEQLKFPVLVIQPAIQTGGMGPFAEWDDIALTKFPERSSRTPVDGTIIIDSAFNQFTQENVSRQKEGELKWFARFLVPGMRVKYTFDLRRAGASGRDALMEQIRHASPFSDDPAEDAALRSAALQQTTMAGVLDALRLFKPVEPAAQNVTEPTTQPDTQLNETDQPTPETVEPEPRDPDRPGERN